MSVGINKALSSAKLFYHKNLIKRFVFKRLGSNGIAAEEIVSEVWVAAWKDWKTFNHKSTYVTWLCKIALNKIADHYRRQIRHKSHFVVPAIDLFNQIADPKISIEEKLVLDELRQKVNKSLKLLPDNYKKLLQLRYYERLANRDISLILKIPIRSIEGQLYRAKKMLAKIYEI